MTVKDLVIVKLKHVKLNYSIGTFNHYNSHLMHFLRWCDANNVVEVSQLDDSKLIDYITDLKDMRKYHYKQTHRDIKKSL